MKKRDPRPIFGTSREHLRTFGAPGLLQNGPELARAVLADILGHEELTWGASAWQRVRNRLARALERLTERAYAAGAEDGREKERARLATSASRALQDEYERRFP